MANKEKRFETIYTQGTSLSILLWRLWTGRGHKHLLHYHHLSVCRHLTNRR